MKKSTLILISLMILYIESKAQSSLSDMKSIPATPSNLTATGFSSSEIHLSWNNVSSETGYYIYRKSGDIYFMIDSTAADDTSYIDHNLQPLEQWCYSIAAYNQDGESIFSNDACASTLASIDEIPVKIEQIIAYPNPFTRYTQITLPKTYHNIALAVYDIQGKLVAQQQYKDCNQIQLNRNQLSNGLYFLKLTLDDKAVETGKIVISE